LKKRKEGFQWEGLLFSAHHEKRKTGTWGRGEARAAHAFIVIARDHEGDFLAVVERGRVSQPKPWVMEQVVTVRVPE